MKKDFLTPVIALFSICLVAAILLAGTNEITKGKIAQAQFEEKQQSLASAFAEAKSFSEEKACEQDGLTLTYSTALSENGEALGYVFITEQKGYGGPVSVMTAITNEGKVKKVIILSMDDETPGLGQNASKPEFLSQFDEKGGELVLSKNAADENEIQGVTSATFTSSAVVDCVNASLKAYKTLFGGEA